MNFKKEDLDFLKKLSLQWRLGQYLHLDPLIKYFKILLNEDSTNTELKLEALKKLISFYQQESHEAKVIKRIYDNFQQRLNNLEKAKNLAQKHKKMKIGFMAKRIIFEPLSCGINALKQETYPIFDYLESSDIVSLAAATQQGWSGPLQLKLSEAKEDIDYYVTLKMLVRWSDYSKEVVRKSIISLCKKGYPSYLFYNLNPVLLSKVPVVRLKKTVSKNQEKKFQLSVDLMLSYHSAVIKGTVSHGKFFLMVMLSHNFGTGFLTFFQDAADPQVWRTRFTQYTAIKDLEGSLLRFSQDGTIDGKSEYSHKVSTDFLNIVNKLLENPEGVFAPFEHEQVSFDDSTRKISMFSTGFHDPALLRKFRSHR
jgi:hypothetical protein